MATAKKSTTTKKKATAKKSTSTSKSAPKAASTKKEATKAKTKAAAKKAAVSKSVKTAAARGKKSEVKKDNNRFAVIAIAGTQLKVVIGGKYTINKLPETKGGTVEVNEVLMVVDGDKVTVGDPYIKGARVVLEIDAQKKR